MGRGVCLVLGWGMGRGVSCVGGGAWVEGHFLCWGWGMGRWVCLVLQQWLRYCMLEAL